VAERRRRWHAAGPCEHVDGCPSPDPDVQWLDCGGVVLVQHLQSHQQKRWRRQVGFVMWEVMGLR
jgi:hypothetical protein